MNNWKNIWEKREANLEKINQADYKAVFAELKRINGFDITDGGIPLAALIQQYEDTKKRMNVSGGGTLFEVGCGCGANLFMFQHDGIKVGGIDYSAKLISIMKDVFPDDSLIECICGEALEMPVEIKYDAVLSNSVFSYFPDFSYAESVLKKMVCKAKASIGLLDIHDVDKKEAFIAYRVANVKDYKERYKDLPKLFYPREFFEKFATKHQLKLEFIPSQVDGYWNNDFVFNCYMYKQ